MKKKIILLAFLLTLVVAAVFAQSRIVVNGVTLEIGQNGNYIAVYNNTGKTQTIRITVQFKNGRKEPFGFTASSIAREQRVNVMGTGLYGPVVAIYR